jgi:hypothetical protein
MRKILGPLVLLGVLGGVLVACGTTPEPTQPPPTQTPWIIVVTATPGPESVAENKPTQTPWIIIATPTRTEKVTPKATEQATASLESTQASPTLTREPGQAEETATQPPPAPTNISDTAALRYPPPALLDPPNNQPVSWKSTVLLKWSSVGDLAEDEYYHVHLERPPKSETVEWWGDYAYTKEPEFLAEAALLAPFHYSADYGHAVVYWWVRVVRKTGVGEDGKALGEDIGVHSEKRTLILEPKPED